MTVDQDEAGWPDPGADQDSKRGLFQARLDDIVAERANARAVADAMAEQDWERVKIGLDAEQALRRAVHDGCVEVAKGAVQRGRAAAEFVRNAAGALVTLYTGAIGATFAVSKTPLPPRGLAPVVFLGAAVVFAAAYAAWVTRPGSVPVGEPTTNLLEREVRRLNSFVDWASELAGRRLYALHASVLALGFGCVLLPTPFLSVSDTFVWSVSGIAGIFMLAVPVYTSGRVRRSNS
jgi:hypothetical protein